MSSSRTERIKCSKISYGTGHTCNLRPYLIVPLLIFGFIAVFGVIVSSVFNNTHAQIEIPANKQIIPSIFNKTQSEDAQPKPDILYSALHSGTITGEVLNNFTYPIEDIRITASVYDKNGGIVATGQTYATEYNIKPDERSGFDIFLDKKLPNNSKYTLTSIFKKSEKEKPEALLLNVGTNSKSSGIFRVLGEVTNQGQDDANSVKVSGIFYDKDHKVLYVNYTYTIPDIISPYKKAPFDLSFYTDHPENIKSMALNVQSDEYSLITNTTQNKTK